MNLLAIRGGGTKGVIPCLMLMTLEQKMGKRISEVFSYFGGCSVGALLTSALLLSDDGVNAKYTSQQVYELFLKHIRNSFSWSYYQYIVSSFFGLIGPKYTTTGLRSVVAECCQDMTMSCLLKPIIIPAYDRKHNRPFYFDKHTHANVKVSDCILSSTAIPTYFESHKVTINDRLHDFLDSALVSNECSQLVLLKATSQYHVIDKSHIFLLSLGTGIYPNVVHENNGLLSWMNNIASTLITGGEANELYELSLSLPETNYNIFDIHLNKSYSPDDVREETINYYIQTTETWIKDNSDVIDTVCKKLLSNL